MSTSPQKTLREYCPASLDQHRSVCLYLQIDRLRQLYLSFTKRRIYEERKLVASSSAQHRTLLHRRFGGSSLPRDSYLAIENPLLLDFTKRHVYTQGESGVGKKDVKTFSWSNGILVFLNRNNWKRVDNVPNSYQEPFCLFI